MNRFSTPFARPAKCAASSCSQPVSGPFRVFCIRHWHFLPLAMRRMVLRAYNRGGGRPYADAVIRAADYIDAASTQAREAGFRHVVAGIDASGNIIRFMGRFA